MRHYLFPLLLLTPLMTLGLTSLQARLLHSTTFKLTPTVKKALSKSRSHVDLISADLKGLEATLIATAKKPIKIRLVADKTPLNHAIAKQLEAAGIDVRYARLPLSYGFMVIDGARKGDEGGRRARVIAASSALNNLKGLHHSLALTPKGHPLAGNYQEEFNYLWQQSYDHGGKVRSSAAQALRLDNETRVVFSSESLVPVQIGSRTILRPATSRQFSQFGTFLDLAFGKARKSIAVAGQKFDRSDIYHGLVKAIRRGVKVKLILPASELQAATHDRDCSTLKETATYFDECLEEMGAEVRYIVSPVATTSGHTIVIDDSYGFSGSFDLSWDSELKTFSHMQVISGHAAHRAKLLLGYLMKKNQERLPALRSRILAKKGYGPCRFASMSLEAEDVAALQKLWRPGVCNR